MARVLITLAAIVATLAPLDLHARQARAVALVLEISGAVFLRSATTGPEIVLDRIRDIGRVLLEGQAIRSGPGGRVRVKLASSVKTLNADDGRYELRYLTGNTPGEQATLASLNAYARPGGSRGVGSVIYAPAHDGVVRLDALDVRWTPRDGSGSLTLSLTASGRAVWSAGDLPGAAGRLTTAATSALRAAMSQYQGANAGVSAWTFTLRDGTGVISTVTFRLLPRAEEIQLTARLREWDQEPEPIARAIGRAFEFGARSLYNDAADEFDRALASAPGSEALLRAAISAHDRTGNSARVRELTQRVTR